LVGAKAIAKIASCPKGKRINRVSQTGMPASLNLLTDTVMLGMIVSAPHTHKAFVEKKATAKKPTATINSCQCQKRLLVAVPEKEK